MIELREARKAIGLLNSMVAGGEQHSESSRQVVDAGLKQLEEFESKINKAQTAIMYDVDGGLLSPDRASRHDREVDVALVVINDPVLVTVKGSVESDGTYVLISQHDTPREEGG